jgi:hypothetical protein
MCGNGGEIPLPTPSDRPRGHEGERILPEMGRTSNRNREFALINLTNLFSTIHTTLLNYATHLIKPKAGTGEALCFRLKSRLVLFIFNRFASVIIRDGVWTGLDHNPMNFPLVRPSQYCTLGASVLNQKLRNQKYPTPPVFYYR